MGAAIEVMLPAAAKEHAPVGAVGVVLRKCLKKVKAICKKYQTPPYQI
jgi:hypothetical protein